MEKFLLFFKCIFNWRNPKFAEEIEQINVDAFFCQSFGPQENNPGISNKFLADSIVQIYNQSPKPLIIQKDCADAFPDNIVIDKIISTHETSGKYLDSHEVSRQCVDYCRQKNLKMV